MSNTTKKTYRAAIYLRLSKEDGDVVTGNKEESNSISNQKALILDYLERFPEIEVASIREDDGYSGVNFDRPGFQMMQEDIKSGRIDCVVVKDLSRFGRNYIETGRYIEQIYPNLGVRFIAINDSYDSADPVGSQSIIVAFKNLINDSYLRDISVKIRSQFDIKRRNGELISAYTPYGYLKSEKDKHKMVIDPFAGEIVKDIFKYKLDGMSANGIANKLNDMKILSPSEYKKSIGINFTSPFQTHKVAKWSNSVIRTILSNEVYTGVMVQGKSSSPNHKVKKKEKLDSKDWIRVANTHDAIIDEFYFDIVQKAMERDVRCSPKSGKVLPLSGMVFCGDCGNVMMHSVVKGRKKSKDDIPKRYDYLSCSGSGKGANCTSHRMNSDDLPPIVLQELRFHIQAVLDLREALQDIDQAPLKTFEVQKIQKRITKKKEEISHMQELLGGLYSDLKDEILEKDEYFKMKKNFEEQAKDASIAIELYENEINQILHSTDNRYEWMEYFKEYKDIKELTRKVATVFINRIFIYEDKRILIKYNFSDVFEQAKEEIMWLQEHNEYGKEAV